MRPSDMNSEYPEPRRNGHGHETRAPSDEPRLRWSVGREDERLGPRHRDQDEFERGGGLRDDPRRVYADERDRGRQRPGDDLPHGGDYLPYRPDRERRFEAPYGERELPYAAGRRDPRDPRDEGRYERIYGPGDRPPRRSFGPTGAWEERPRPGLRRDYGWSSRDDYRYGHEAFGGDLGDEDRFGHDERGLWTERRGDRHEDAWRDEGRARGTGMIGARGYSGLRSPDYQPGVRWQGPGARQLRGPYFGRGPRNYRRSDDRISEDIHDRLTAHPEIDASDVEIRVQDGDVTVSGSVEDRWTRHRVEDVIDEVLGVRDIDNKLRIHREGFEGDRLRGPGRGAP